MASYKAQPHPGNKSVILYDNLQHSVLEDIIEQKQQEVRGVLERLVPDGVDKAFDYLNHSEGWHMDVEKINRLAPGVSHFVQSFKNSSLSVRLMLEIKPKSPSAGAILTDDEVLLTQELINRIEHYADFACALSVLTDTPFFGGSLQLLEQTREVLLAYEKPLPILRKDFIIHPIQLIEAKQAGASAVLLIAKILSDEALSLLFHAALALKITPVIEIQCEAELERIQPLLTETLIPQQAILINNRNLTTMHIDLNTTARLASQLPSSLLIIAASGIEQPADVEKILPHTPNLLIGTHLMKTPVNELNARIFELMSVRL